MQLEKCPKENGSRLVSLDEYRQRCSEVIHPKEHYDWIKTLGLEYGPMFQGITHIFRGENEALVYISLPEKLRVESRDYQIHPVLLDACFQTIAIAASRLKNTDEPISYLPVGFERIDLFADLQPEIWCLAEIDPSATWGAPFIQGQLTLLRQDGTVLGQVKGFKVARLDGRANQKSLYYDLNWKKTEWAPSHDLDQKERWVIINDRFEIGDQLIQHLNQHGAEVVVVSNQDMVQSDQWK
jgi:myxalamid-type polyketide synthase MxaE and MxaD